MPLFRVITFKFVTNLIFLKSRILGLTISEEIAILAFFILIQYQSVTDRQTNAQTTVVYLYQRLACYHTGDNCKTY